MQSIFGTDGIRGKFNEEITYSLAYKVGNALGLTLENNNPILIGRDTRVSGDILVQAIAKGISDSGKEFINIGICPTPAIPFLKQILWEPFLCKLHTTQHKIRERLVYR